MAEKKRERENGDARVQVSAGRDVLLSLEIPVGDVVRDRRGEKEWRKTVMQEGEEDEEEEEEECVRTGGRSLSALCVLLKTFCSKFFWSFM